MTALYAPGGRRAVPLPTVVLVADSSATAGRPLVATVREAVRAGIKAVWLREKHLPDAERWRVAAELAELVHCVGGVLLASPGAGSDLADFVHLGAAAGRREDVGGTHVGGDGGMAGAPAEGVARSGAQISGRRAEGAARSGAQIFASRCISGNSVHVERYMGLQRTEFAQLHREPGRASPSPVHSPSAGPSPSPSLPSSPRPWGRSCHSRADLEEAANEGASWATLSPIFPSISKPGYGPTLGTEALSEVPLPTWALGGISPSDARLCLEAGAAGVAVMGAVLGTADPGNAVEALFKSLEGVLV